MSININGVAVHPNCVARNSNFRGAAFNRVNMHHSDFRYSDFDGVNLVNSNISHSKLEKASFAGACLTGTNFQFCKLDGTDFSGALWGEADIRNTDLRTAKLHYGYFANVLLDKTTVFPDFQIPQNVDLPAWKVFRSRGRPVIGEIVVPRNSRRTACLGSDKCRAEHIQLLSLANGETSATSWHQPDFVYNVGSGAIAASYDSDIRKECAPGIHFFADNVDAERYAKYL